MDQNRKTAYEVLLDIEVNGSYSNLCLNRIIKKNEPENPSFVRELVYGTLENQLRIDYIANQFIKTGTKKLRAKELIILRLAIYQIVYLDSVPSYAAVDEAVKMAKKFAYGKDKFVNGVLRSFLKSENKEYLPNNEDMVEYLSIKYSCKRWIIELWLEQFSIETVEVLLQESNKRSPLVIRTNRLKVSKNDLISILKTEGFEATTVKDNKLGIQVKGTGLLSSRLFNEGYFSVQDSASMLAALTMEAQPGELIIDVCAAPGGKSFAMAEAMGNNGKIISMDIYEHKLAIINEGAKRLGISIVDAVCHDSTSSDASLFGKADRVLVDAPCSGLGVIRRKPEIKLKDTPNVEELYRIQYDILCASASYLKSKGTLVYSTCTINKNENERMIEKFLDEHSSFKLCHMKQYLTGDNNMDGFFIAKLMLE